MRNGTVRLCGFRVELVGGAVNGIANWETGGKRWENAERTMREVGFMRKGGRDRSRTAEVGGGGNSGP